MAQKINSVGFRLKDRLNWNNSLYAWSNKFTTVLHKNIVLEKTYAELLHFLKFLDGGFYITKDSKKYQIFTKMIPFVNNFINRKEFFCKKQNIYKITKPNKKDYTEVLRERYLKEQLNIEKLLKFNPKNIDFCSSLLNLDQENNVRGKFLLFPKILTNYISLQIKNPLRFKNKTFSKNLNQGIFIFINSLLRICPFSDSILGVRIGFYGKWQKTRNGKKQALNFYWGRLKSPTISNIIFFSAKPVITKFGVCNIKIWISLKKNKQSFLA